MFIPLLIAAIQSAQLTTLQTINAFRTPDEMAAVAPHAASVEQVPQGLRATFQVVEWPNLSFNPPAPWDWSNAGGLALEVANPSSTPVTFGVRIDDDKAADGWNHSRSGQISLAPESLQTVVFQFGPDPMSLGMRALPPFANAISISVNGAGTFDRSHVVALQLFLHQPGAPTSLVFGNLRTVAPRNLVGIVDQFGQYSGADWPGKVHSLHELQERSAKERASVAARPSDRDRFGGWNDGPRLTSTGFFRTEMQGGKWWFVDPDGRLFFSFGVDVVNFSNPTMVTGREAMFEWLPGPSDPFAPFETQTSFIHAGPVKSGKVFDFYGANVYRSVGTGGVDAWRTSTIDRLLSWGYNTIGNWSDDGLAASHRMPYVATVSVDGDHARISSGSDYWAQMHDPFDPKFRLDVARSIAGIAARVKDDPWCLGYFVDNELSWVGSGPNGQLGLGLGALSAPAGSPAKAALVEQLKAKYQTVDALNAAWKTQFASWEGLKSPDALTDASRADLSAFISRFALRYFRTVKEELVKVDPNHLYLGCRFAWSCPEAVEAAARVVDVVSFNIYEKSVDEPRWRDLIKLGKPCIIGEFHFGALDRGMFHPGLVDAQSQTGRAELYRQYVTSVLRNSALVGCHWFQYADEPVTGRYFDGENYNIGLVSITDLAYPELTASAKAVQYDGYRIRSGH
jgi:hypothetical protein